MNKRQRKKKNRPVREWLKAVSALLLTHVNEQLGLSNEGRQWFKLTMKD